MTLLSRLLFYLSFFFFFPDSWLGYSLKFFYFELLLKVNKSKRNINNMLSWIQLVFVNWFDLWSLYLLTISITFLLILKVFLKYNKVFLVLRNLISTDLLLICYLTHLLIYLFFLFLLCHWLLLWFLFKVGFYVRHCIRINVKIFLKNIISHLYIFHCVWKDWIILLCVVKFRQRNINKPLNLAQRVWLACAKKILKSSKQARPQFT